MKPVKTVESSDKVDFENACAELYKLGYVLSSSNCGFVDSQEYGFCSCYHAVFVLPLSLANKEE